MTHSVILLDDELDIITHLALRAFGTEGMCNASVECSTSFCHIYLTLCVFPGPFMRAVTGDKVAELCYDFQLSSFGALQAEGENWVALLDDKIVATAGWFGPGHVPLDSFVSLPCSLSTKSNSSDNLKGKAESWWIQSILLEDDSDASGVVGKQREFLDFCDDHESRF